MSRSSSSSSGSSSSPDTRRRPPKRPKKKKPSSSASSSSSSSSSDTKQSPPQRKEKHHKPPPSSSSPSSGEEKSSDRRRKGVKKPSKSPERTGTRRSPNQSRRRGRKSPEDGSSSKRRESPEDGRSKRRESPEDGRSKRRESPEKTRRRKVYPEEVKKKGRSPEKARRRDKSPETRRTRRDRSPEVSRKRRESPEKSRDASPAAESSRGTRRSRERDTDSKDRPIRNDSRSRARKSEEEDRSRRNEGSRSSRGDTTRDSRRRRSSSGERSPPRRGGRREELRELVITVDVKDDPDDVKMEINEENDVKIEVKGEPAEAGPSAEEAQLKREPLSQEEEPEEEVPAVVSTVGDWQDSDEDAVKMQPTDEDLDWFNRKRQAARHQSDEGRGEAAKKARHDSSGSDTSAKSEEPAKTPVYSPRGDRTPVYSPEAGGGTTPRGRRGNTPEDRQEGGGTPEGRRGNTPEDRQEGGGTPKGRRGNTPEGRRSPTPEMDRLGAYDESRVEQEEGDGSPGRVVETVGAYRESRLTRHDTDDSEDSDVADEQYTENRITGSKEDEEWFKSKEEDKSPEREPVHNRLGTKPESEEKSREKSKESSRERSREKGGRRDRSRNRSRDRSRNRSRDRSRDRSRGKRSRSRERRSRSRERIQMVRDRRNRSRDRRDRRDRPRDQSRDRRRSRDRGDERPEHRFRARNERRRDDNKGEKKGEREAGKKEEVLPRKPKPEENLLSMKSGGAYMPPHKLRALQAGITDKGSEQYQRLTWQALKKSLNGLINKVSIENIKDIVVEMFGENLVRGKGLFVRALMTAQSQATPFTNVYSAAVAVINTKFPDLGDLLLDRLILQFKRSYLRNQKAICLSTVMFIGHLVNQQVVNEILCLEILTLLLEKATADSVEISIALLKEVGARLDELSPRAMHGIFDRLRSLLQEGDLEIRVKYMIEVMFAVRKDKFKDHPTFAPGLELVEEEDQITHLKQLDDKVKGNEILNVFKYDLSYEENAAKFQLIKNEILGSESEGDAEDEDDSSDPEEEEALEIIDKTGTNMQAMRRTIYLTIQSSLTFEECIHKLGKLQLKPGQEPIVVKMIIECCSQERSYNKFYGLLGERYCRLKREYIPIFAEVFQEQFETIHRLETNKLRNVACCYAHMLYTDALPWTVFSIIRLTETETTSSSRVFIKVLLQEIASQMGEGKMKERFADKTLQVCFDGLFPRDDPRNTRFSINYFTAIGLGYLTEELREWLKTAPPPAPTLLGLGDSSSSDSSSGSSSSSSSSSSDSSSDSEDEKAKKTKKKLSKAAAEETSNKIPTANKENTPAPVPEKADWAPMDFHPSRRPAEEARGGRERGDRDHDARRGDRGDIDRERRRGRGDVEVEEKSEWNKNDRRESGSREERNDRRNDDRNRGRERSDEDEIRSVKVSNHKERRDRRERSEEVEVRREKRDRRDRREKSSDAEEEIKHEKRRNKMEKRGRREESSEAEEKIKHTKRRNREDKRDRRENSSEDEVEKKRVRNKKEKKERRRETSSEDEVEKEKLRNKREKKGKRDRSVEVKSERMSSERVDRRRTDRDRDSGRHRRDR